MPNHIVTRDRFSNLILRKDDTGMHAIGRALVLLHFRQTHDERRDTTTRWHNERGFRPNDARQGTLDALYYRKHGSLQDWQMARWRALNGKGVPRLAKYWRQMDEEAHIKAAEKKAA